MTENKLVNVFTFAFIAAVLVALGVYLVEVSWEGWMEGGHIMALCLAPGIVAMFVVAGQTVHACFTEFRRHTLARFEYELNH